MLLIHNKGEDITHINIALSNKERIVTSFIVDACQNVFLTYLDKYQVKHMQRKLYQISSHGFMKDKLNNNTSELK